MNLHKILKIYLPLAIVLLLLNACKVTQTYQRPAVLPDSLYRGVNAQDTNAISRLSWKELYENPRLQALIEEAIQNNLDLKVAAARIKQAEANYRQSGQAFFPGLAANATTTLQHPSEVQGAANKRVFELYASSSWEADIWGKLRSTRRAQLAALLQSEAYKRYVQTQLVSQLAGYYYTLESYDAQLAITLKTIENRKEDVETVTLLKNSDAATGADVVQSKANLYSAEVTIPDIKQDIRKTENAICILLGRAPGAIQRDSLMQEQLITQLATGVPAQLLSYRPDVQEAEYQLRNAFELTNVARTYFYPSLSITGQAGLYNNSISQFFNAGSLFASLVGGLTQPVFNNGLNKQRLAVARAQQEEYVASYKSVILTAGQEVSDALYQYQAASDKIKIRSLQIENLQKAVEFNKDLLKYAGGVSGKFDVNYTDVLTSEQNYLTAQLNSINDKLQQLQAVVALYRSLGGGWK